MRCLQIDYSTNFKGTALKVKPQRRAAFPLESNNENEQRNPPIMTNPVISGQLPDDTFIPVEGTDFELDYRGLIDGEEAWEWTSCGPTFSNNYSSDDTFSRQDAAIQDATTFLASVYNEPTDLSEIEETATGIDIELAETSPYQSGVHFALYTCEDREGVYWQGLCQEPGEQALWWGEGDFSEYSSDRGYFNAQYAAADAIYCFHRLRQHSAVDAITLCYELTLPIHQVIEEHFVRLTVSQASGYGVADGDVEAMSLAAKEEALIDRTEAEAFMTECHGWPDVSVTYEDGTTFTNAERFNGGYGVVLHIDSEDWAKWLAGYELVEDPNSEHIAAYLRTQ